MNPRPAVRAAPASPVRLLAVVSGVLVAGAVVAGVLAYPGWRADRALSRAEAAADAADLGAARSHLEEHLRYRPGSARGHLLLAQTARRADNLGEARRLLREAAGLGAPPPELEVEGHLIEAQEVGPRGPNEKALQALALTRHPAERQIYEALAKGYRNVHRPEDAVKWLGIWTERHPGDWLPRQWRGEILEAFNLTADARADYLRVIELRPTHVPALRRLGRLELVDRQDPAAAAVHFAAVLDVEPDDPAALVGLAECRRAAGDQAGGRPYLDRALARNPGDPLACLEYALAEADAGRTAEALGWATRAAAGLPDEPQLRYRLGVLFNRLGDPDQAGRQLARFHELDASIRRTTEWTKQLLKDPSDADLRYRIGAEFFRLGRDQTGLAWVSSALLEKPDHPASHRELAAYYRRVGDPGRADYHDRLAAPQPQGVGAGRPGTP